MDNGGISAAARLGGLRRRCLLHTARAWSAIPRWRVLKVLNAGLRLDVGAQRNETGPGGSGGP